MRIRIRYRDYATNWFDQLLVPQAAMAELADGTGWQIADLIGESDQRHHLAVLEKQTGPHLPALPSGKPR